MNRSVPDELISAYFDGEVTPDERSEIERLLESAPELRQQLDETSRLSALLHSFPREAAPRHLAANVLQLIESKALPSAPTVSPGRHSLKREWSAFGAGILATMASVLSFVAFNHSPVAPNPAANRQDDFAIRSMHRSWHVESEQLAMQESLPRSEDVSHDRSTTTGAAPSRASKRDRPVSEPAVELKSAARMATDVVSSHFDAAPAGAPLAPALPAAAPAEKQEASPESPVGFVAEGLSGNLEAGNVTFFSHGTSNTLQSQSQNDFLWSLANGDVIVTRVADPTNTVAVIDMTVVDIDRGAEELKILLQQRSVQQVNQDRDGVSRRHAASDVSSSEKEFKDTRDSAKADEFQVFYVLAPGEQLAGAIDDLVKNHPDIYRNWTPQPPIELPVSTAKLAEAADARTPSTSAELSDSKKKVESELPQEVNGEADRAVDVLIARNSLSYSNGIQQGNSLLPSNSPSHNFGSDLNLKRYTEAPALNTKDNQKPEDSPSPGSDSARTSGQYSEQSYFRVSRENFPQLGISNSQNSVANLNSGLPIIPTPSLNFDNQTGSQDGSQLANDSPEQKTSKLVRMLIVLKSEQPPAPPKP